MFERSESTGCFTWIGLYILYWFVSMLFSLWLWNWIMVDIFSLPTLSFWQMFGVKLCLSCIMPTKVTVKRG